MYHLHHWRIRASALHFPHSAQMPLDLPIWTICCLLVILAILHTIPPMTNSQLLFIMYHILKMMVLHSFVCHSLTTTVSLYIMTCYFQSTFIKKPTHYCCIEIFFLTLLIKTALISLTFTDCGCGVPNWFFSFQTWKQFVNDRKLIKIMLIVAVRTKLFFIVAMVRSIYFSTNN